MRMAESTWRDMDTTTIQNCWHKSGILPEIPASSPVIQPSIPISSLLHAISESHMDPLAQAEKQVENALDDLQTRGVLHRDHRLDIESLLNPQNEAHITAEASDKDIYQAVMDAIEAWENVEKKGGDDVDKDGPVKACLSRSKVLKAISTTMEYVLALDNPLACKIETLLGSLIRLIRKDKARSMRNTILTDFFQKL